MAVYNGMKGEREEREGGEGEGEERSGEVIGLLVGYICFSSFPLFTSLHVFFFFLSFFFLNVI